MSFLRRLFGTPPDTPESHREKADRAMNSLAGVQGRAKLSKRGRPVCPRCWKEFPATPEMMQDLREKNPGSLLMFECARCHSRIRVY
jgi:DNA-directed RNA polymerase subunit RPC12/RpoP